MTSEAEPVAAIPDTALFESSSGADSATLSTHDTTLKNEMVFATVVDKNPSLTSEKSDADSLSTFGQIWKHHNDEAAAMREGGGTPPPGSTKDCLWESQACLLRSQIKSASCTQDLGNRVGVVAEDTKEAVGTYSENFFSEKKTRERAVAANEIVSLIKAGMATCHGTIDYVVDSIFPQEPRRKKGWRNSNMNLSEDSYSIDPTSTEEFTVDTGTQPDTRRAHRHRRRTPPGSTRTFEDSVKSEGFTDETDAERLTDETDVERLTDETDAEESLVKETRMIVDSMIGGLTLSNTTDEGDDDESVLRFKQSLYEDFNHKLAKSKEETRGNSSSRSQEMRTAQKIASPVTEKRHSPMLQMRTSPILQKRNSPMMMMQERKNSPVGQKRSSPSIARMTASSSFQDRSSPVSQKRSSPSAQMSQQDRAAVRLSPKQKAPLHILQNNVDVLEAIAQATSPLEVDELVARAPEVFVRQAGPIFMDPVAVSPMTVDMQLEKTASPSEGGTRSKASTPVGDVPHTPKKKAARNVDPGEIRPKQLEPMRPTNLEEVLMSYSDSCTSPIGLSVHDVVEEMINPVAENRFVMDDKRERREQRYDRIETIRAPTKRDPIATKAGVPCLDDESDKSDKSRDTKSPDPTVISIYDADNMTVDGSCGCDGGGAVDNENDDVSHNAVRHTTSNSNRRQGNKEVFEIRPCEVYEITSSEDDEASTISVAGVYGTVKHDSRQRTRYDYDAVQRKKQHHHHEQQLSGVISVLDLETGMERFDCSDVLEEARDGPSSEVIDLTMMEATY